MCTVTYIPAGDKTFLTSNRDERRLRRPALPPAVHRLRTGRILFPRDAEAGGTWFAVHENGNVLVLLNGAFIPHSSQAPYRRSRGLILLDLADSESPLQTFRDLPLQGIEPFTLVLLEKGRLYACRWDGQEKKEEQPDPSLPHIWSSVTLYTPEVIDQRRGWFETWLLENPTPLQDDVLQLHTRTGDDPRNDLRMDRDGRLLTLSITSLERTSGAADLQYLDLLAGGTDRQRLLFTGARMETA